MSAEIASLDLHGAREKISTGKLLAAELAAAQSQRIIRWDAMVHSFIHVAGPARSTRPLSTSIESPLAGIRVGIKDIFDTADMPTTGNSRLFIGRQPPADATAVAALRRAGGVIAGKLAAWELAVGGTSLTLPWPPVRNPWDLTRDPGGSSTGSAAALAAGFVLGALGSDTGGSIREPAAWCGLAGLKPTFGLLDTTGVMAASRSLDHIGPMARSSRDCGILLEVLADAPAAYTADIGAGVESLRIGIVDFDGEARLDLRPAIANAVDGAVTALAAGGATLRRVRLPPLAAFSAVCTLISAAEGYELHHDSLARTPELYDPLTRQRLLAGRMVQASDRAAAHRLQARLIREVLALMEALDLLLMPTTRDTAPLLGGFDSHGGHPSLCRPWNVTGFPALSVRYGFDAAGLPIGLQIVGRPLAEALLLRCGHSLEQSRDDRGRWPNLERLKPPVSPQWASAPSDEIGLAALAAVTAEAKQMVRRY